LTGDISSDADGIVIERDNATLNGSGHKIEGTGSGTGVTLSGRTNVTVMNLEISMFSSGVYLSGSSTYNHVHGNSIVGGGYTGIMLEPNSSHNNISSNNIDIAGYIEQGCGILLMSNDNYVSANSVTATEGWGIVVAGSNNKLRNNNMVNSMFNFALAPEWFGPRNLSGFYK